MYLIENEVELKQLKQFLIEVERFEAVTVDPKELTILKKVVRRMGRLKETVVKPQFESVMAQEELEYFKGLTFWIQWVGFREFSLHKQLAPALSKVLHLDWDFETIKALACFLAFFYDVEETEIAYIVQVKPFLSRLGEGDFYQLEKDLTAVWMVEGEALVH